MTLQDTIIEEILVLEAEKNIIINEIELLYQIHNELRMKKVFIYKMHAGCLGTDETLLHVGEEGLSDSTQWEHAVAHAEGYGNEQIEDEEWHEDFSEPEIWLAATVTTIAELDEESGYILCGNETLEGLVVELEQDGMVWQ